MTVVDTSVWIDWFRGSLNAHTLWLDGALGRTALGVSDLVLMEVLQGVHLDRDFERVHGELKRRCTLFNTGGEKLATASARNYRFLRAKGLTVRKPVDSLIATFCIVAGFSLLHRDRDFDAFEKHLGLKVMHPSTH